MEVLIKRVYDPVEESDGLRVLVDRLWPRGIKKSDLKYDIWAKDIAPSPELRRLFHADPSSNWDVFSSGYEKELQHSKPFLEFMEILKDKQPSRITLLYAFRNKIKNHALILQQVMRETLANNL